MIVRTLVASGWIALRRDRTALLLTFVLPIVFFTIFALIFGGTSAGGGGGGGGGTRAIVVLPVDEDGTDASRRFVDALGRLDALELRRTMPAPTAATTDGEPGADATSTDGAPWTRETARRAVRRGTAPVAVIVPKGFAERFGNFVGDRAAVEVVHDPANPIAANAVQGLVQAAAFQGAPDVLMTKGLEQLEAAGGFLTPAQRELVDRIAPALRGDAPWSSVDGDRAEGDASPGDPGDDAEANDAPAFTGLVDVTAIDVRSLDPARDDGDVGADGKAKRPSVGSMVAYYAAGIGTMFLLFSCAGAAGSLLEEEESGTLARMLDLQVPMSRILLGKWSFFTAMGLAQIVLMFVYGAIVFGLPLFTAPHLAGFLTMAVPTAAAAAAFGVLLACLCRSRAQLGGLSTIVILVMSALGGSMVPRFVMPAFMETTSRFTFNGWALDGFLKVFWYDDPSLSLAKGLARLAPEVGVLVGMTVAFLAAARLAARRWESA